MDGPTFSSDLKIAADDVAATLGSYVANDEDTEALTPEYRAWLAARRRENAPAA